MFFDKVDQLRRASEPEKEHFAKVFTLTVVIIITVIWFFFTVPALLGRSMPSAPQAASSTPPVPTAPLQAPF